MLKTQFAAALVVAALALGSAAAFAQSPYAKANTPVATPITQAHQQAQLDQNPGACGDIAARAADSVGLRIQQNSPGGETRQSVNAMLLAAKNAAAAGDYDSC